MRKRNQTGARRRVTGREEGLVPVERYVSPAFAALEHEKLWPYVWQVACRQEDLPSVGDYLEYVIGDQSILLVRVEPDLIKAYHNACLHRGTRLKRGCGSAVELRCMFHSWCWNLDGTNKEVTDRHDFPGIDRVDLRLPECRVGSWGGFVFVNLNPDAEPLEDYLGTVPELFAAFPLEQYRCQSWRQTILPANWKVPIDNFGESYHVNGLHPQQLPFIDDVNVLYEGIGIHSREICPSGVASPRLRETVDQNEVLASLMDSVVVTFHQEDRRKGEIEPTAELTVPEGMTARQVLCDLKRKRLESLGLDASRFSDSQLIDGYGLTLFPNTALFINVGEVFLFRTRPSGGDPNSCIADLINLDLPAPDESRPRIEVRQIPDWEAYDWGTVIEQDLKCFREVQIGMHSRRHPGLRLAAYQETRLRTLHKALSHYVERP